MSMCESCWWKWTTCSRVHRFGTHLPFYYLHYEHEVDENITNERQRKRERESVSIPWRCASISKTLKPPIHTHTDTRTHKHEHRNVLGKGEAWSVEGSDKWLMDNRWMMMKGWMGGCLVYSVGERAGCSSECWPNAGSLVPAGISARITWPTEHRCVCKD